MSTQESSFKSIGVMIAKTAQALREYRLNVTLKHLLVLKKKSRRILELEAKLTKELGKKLQPCVAIDEILEEFESILFR